MYWSCPLPIHWILSGLDSTSLPLAPGCFPGALCPPKADIWLPGILQPLYLPSAPWEILQCYIFLFLTLYIIKELFTWIEAPFPKETDQKFFLWFFRFSHFLFSKAAGSWGWVLNMSFSIWVSLALLDSVLTAGFSFFFSLFFLHWQSQISLILFHLSIAILLSLCFKGNFSSKKL